MTEETKFGVSRRTLAKGAAWSVPAVAVAAAAPAYAVSGIITLTGQNCKLPGNSLAPYNDGAVYIMKVNNASSESVTISIDKVVRGGTTQDQQKITVVNLSTCCDVGDTFTVPAYTSGNYALITSDWGNSANTALEVHYKANGVAAKATTPPNDLNPFGIKNDCSGTTGSCQAISEEYKLCIAGALGFPNCPACNGKRNAGPQDDSTEVEESSIPETQVEEPKAQAGKTQETAPTKETTPVEPKQEAKSEEPPAEQPAPAGEPPADEPAPADEPEADAEN